MPQPRQLSDDAPRILFCPFCREGFEGHDECPEHDLTLIPLDRLPRRAEGGPDAVTFFADPRFGRGGTLIGATLVIIGFLAPFVTSRGITASALEVATDAASSLWLTPGAAVIQLWILWRRRSGARMRMARAAVFGVALGGAVPLLYTVWRIGRVAEAYAADVQWLSGAWIMTGGLLLSALTSPYLGRSQTTEVDQAAP